MIILPEPWTNSLCDWFESLAGESTAEWVPRLELAQ
jgi:hypothetical protein